jgi:hypothetical protein
MRFSSHHPNGPRSIYVSLSMTDNTSTPRLTEADLFGFIGTESYHRHVGNVLLTDGTLYLAQKAGAFWLMDIIASVQGGGLKLSMRAEGLQFWTITVHEDNSATVVCTDGGKHDNEPVELYRQDVPSTDFPLGRGAPFLLLVGEHFDRQQRRNMVIMLTSER